MGLLALTAILVDLSLASTAALSVAAPLYYALEGLRATARMALLASAASPYSLLWFEYRAAYHPPRRRCSRGCILLMTVELRVGPMRHWVTSQAPQVYQMLRRLPPGRSPTVPMGSTTRFHGLVDRALYPLVNGYTGSTPRTTCDDE